MNWFTISILPRHSHSFLNLNISMTWPVRTRRSPEQSRHKIIPKRVEFLWSARNKTRVPQNIRKSIRSNSPTAQLISALGDTCIYRFFFLFFLVFSFFFSCFFSCDSSKWLRRIERQEQAYTTVAWFHRGPHVWGHSFRFEVPRIRWPETPPVKQSAP